MRTGIRNAKIKLNKQDKKAFTNFSWRMWRLGYNKNLFLKMLFEYCEGWEELDYFPTYFEAKEIPLKELWFYHRELMEEVLKDEEISAGELGL